MAGAKRRVGTGSVVFGIAGLSGLIAITAMRAGTPAPPARAGSPPARIKLPATSPQLALEGGARQKPAAKSASPPAAPVGGAPGAALGIQGQANLPAGAQRPGGAGGRVVVSRFTVNGTSGWRLSTPEDLPLATPAFAQGKLYFGGGYGSHAFYAVDAATGKTAWQIATEDDGPTAAVVEGDDVLFNTESCTLYCVDAGTGKMRWKKWLGDPLMNQPAAWAGKVYMAYPGKDGRHHLTCIEIRSGKELWNSTISGDIISAPVLDGGVAYLSTLDGTVYAFDALTGKRAWSKQYNATSAPWVHEKQIYVSLREPGAARKGAQDRTAGAPGKPGAAPGAASAPAESVARVDTSAGREIGQRQAQRSAEYLTRSYNAAQKKDSLYKNQDAGVGFAGAAPPSAKIDQAGANFGLSNVASVWAYQGSRPCVYRGRLYTAQHDLLRCTEARTGRLYWEAQFTDTKRYEGGRALLPPAVAGDSVFAATATGQLFCLDSETGKIRWHVEVGEPVSFQPVVMNGRIYLATDRGSVFSIDARAPKATGWAMWGGNAQHNGWITAAR